MTSLGHCHGVTRDTGPGQGPSQTGKVRFNDCDRGPDRLWSSSAEATHSKYSSTCWVMGWRRTSAEQFRLGRKEHIGGSYWRCLRFLWCAWKSERIPEIQKYCRTGTRNHWHENTKQVFWYCPWNGERIYQSAKITDRLAIAVLVIWFMAIEGLWCRLYGGPTVLASWNFDIFSGQVISGQVFLIAPNSPIWPETANAGNNSQLEPLDLVNRYLPDWLN